MPIVGVKVEKKKLLNHFLSCSILDVTKTSFGSEISAELNIPHNFMFSPMTSQQQSFQVLDRNLVSSLILCQIENMNWSRYMIWPILLQKLAQVSFCMKRQTVQCLIITPQMLFSLTVSSMSFSSTMYYLSLSLKRGAETSISTPMMEEVNQLLFLRHSSAVFLREWIGQISFNSICLYDDYLKANLQRLTYTYKLTNPEQSKKSNEIYKYFSTNSEVTKKDYLCHLRTN